MSWARDGIRVNGITPGGTATEMIDAWEAATPGIIEGMTATIPLGRMAEPRKVAGVGRVAAQRPRLLCDRRNRAGRRGRRRLKPGYAGCGWWLSELHPVSRAV